MSERVMTVEGVKVPFDRLEKAFASLEASFTYFQIQAAIAATGVDSQSSYRAADRFLQIKRRAGEVAYSSKSKTWEKLNPSKQHEVA